MAEADQLAGWDDLEGFISAGPGTAAPPASHADALAEAFAPAGEREWRGMARPEQLAVANSETAFTLLLAGRGMGKTWTASHTFAEWAMEDPGYYAIIAPTFGDCRALCVEGPSGILRALGAPNGEPGGDLLRYDKSKNELHLVNGSVLVMCSDEAPGRLRGPNYSGAWCVAEGEPVVTARGRVPIERVRVGDRVATRSGWRAVTAATRTKRDAPTLRITTDAGSIRVTADHPVWVDGVGWTRADAVTPGHAMLAWCDSHQHGKTRPTALPRGKSGVMNAGIEPSPGTTRTGPGSCCTVPSGSPSTAPSRTATTSTTATSDRSTTSSTTCNCSPSPSTEPSTCATGTRSSRTRPATPPEAGRSNSGRPGSLATSRAMARGAASCFSRPECARDSALTDAGLLVTVRTVEQSTISDVYDLTVDGAHEFYAGNGALLVHNCDEIGSWRNVKATWEEGVLFSTRIGKARKLMTGTPKRGHKLVVEFHDRGVRGDDDVTLIRGKTEDNAANLSPEFLRTIRAKYTGTTLGKQELEGLLLADAEGAIVTTELIDATRVRPENVPTLYRVMVGVDPAVTSRESSDHTGIVVVGIGGPPSQGYTGSPASVAGGHVYVLADESVRATPRAWAERVLKVAETWAADAITAEVNQGGDLVTTMLRMVAESDGLHLPRLIPVRAAVGKRTRAEPVAGVWEQNRVHVVGGLRDVEDQWAGWVPGSSDDSPDQLDACVWAAVGLLPELGVNASPPVRIIASSSR